MYMPNHYTTKAHVFLYFKTSLYTDYREFKLWVYYHLAKLSSQHLSISSYI
jgi:hypothetical protein